VACEVGHVNVVKALLQHDTVDVDFQGTSDGVTGTALDVARIKGHVEVVSRLEAYNEHVLALEEMRRRQELFNRRSAESGAGQKETQDPL
jgi:ankyrin repeat protein